LPFEAVLQEYLQFPYKYFLLFLPLFKGYCCILLSVTQSQKKKSQGLRLAERAGQIPLLIILFPKASDKACLDIRAVWAAAETSRSVFLLLLTLGIIAGE
jgi:hypothetical protein